MIKHKAMLSLAIISTLLLGGCTKTTDSVIEYTSTSIEKKQEDKYTSNTVEFNLGDRVYETSSNRQMPYKLRGVLSMPEGEGKFPLVFIVHGCHNNEDEDKRFDTGFEYLTKALADNGYIAVALDLNQPYIWKYGDSDEVEKITALTKEHLKKLKEANSGTSDEYPLELKDKIDMSKIGLIGHSRGGETIFDVSNELIKQGESITSLLSIAPALVKADTPYLENDIDTSILVPELDGDVIGLDGYGIYEILTSKDRKELTSVTLLENANHNYFNKNVTRNDASAWEYTKNIDKQISREDQENFTGQFAVDFMNASMNDEIENTLYDESTSSVSNMYGYNVKNLVTNKNSKSIVSLEKSSDFTGKDVSIEATQYSMFYKDDKTNGLRVPLTGDERADIKKLINFKWEKLESEVSFNPTINDFSKSNSLQLDMLVNPADKLNEKNENQSFTVQLKDKKGNTSRVILGKDVNALDYIEGELEMTEIFDERAYYWSNPTPLTTIKIPLKSFEGVDLGNIKEISFIFDKTNSGSVMVSKIQVD